MNILWCEVCNLHTSIGIFGNPICSECQNNHLTFCHSDFRGECIHKSKSLIKAEVLLEELALHNEFLSKLGYNKREAIKTKIKSEVLKRDNYECKKCGSKNNLHIDHIIPVTKGGKNLLNNLQVLCQQCNISKSNRNAIQYAEVG